MSNDTLITTVGFGSSTFSNESIRVSAFVVKPEWERSFPSKTFQSQGRTQAYAASEYPEVNGNMYTGTVLASAGSIFMVQSRHTYKGAIYMSSGLLFRLRKGAPLLNVSARMVEDYDSKLGESFLAFTGYADILREEDFGLFGIVPNQGWVDSHLDPEDRKECFIIEEIKKAEINLESSVDPDSGSSFIPRRKRRIRINS